MSGIGEVIGIVSAVASLTELSGKILKEGYSYTRTAIEATTQLRQLLSEVSSLDVLLNRVQDLAVDSSRSSYATLAKVATDDRWNECETLLKNVMKAVNRCKPHQGHTVVNLARKAQWPLEKKETTILMQHLQRLRSYFDSAILMDTAVKVDSAVEGIRALRDREEYNSLISWACLAEIDNNTYLHNSQRTRYPGTCQWLLRTAEYITWKDERHNKILWINGPAGAGKTVMSAVIVQNLQEAFSGPDDAVLYFSLDHRDLSKQTLTAILSHAVRQLLHVKPEGVQLIRSLKEAISNNTEKRPTAKLQMDLLKDVSKTYFKNVFYVIDALDESVSAAETRAIIECLSCLTQDDNPKESRAIISTLCTSRRLLYIERLFNQLGGVEINVDLKSHLEILEDIRTYVTGQVETTFAGQSTSRHGRQLSVGDLKEQAIEIVTAKADGLFLQAKYHLTLLSDAPSIRDIRLILKRLPGGLTDTYNLILNQIRRKHSKHMVEIMRILRWITGAREPMTVAALAEAAVMEPDDTSFDVEAMWSSADQLLLMLSSLITVDHDHEPALVRFSHYSVKEYLQSRELEASEEFEFYIDPQTVDRELARVTLQYLSFDEFAEPDPVYLSDYRVGISTLPSKSKAAHYGHASIQDRTRYLQMTKRLVERSEDDLKRKLDDYPLLTYAATFWFEHVKRARITASELSKLTPGLSRWLFDPEGNDPRFHNWTEIHCSGCVSSHNCEQKQPPLYFALLFGVLPWVQSLVANINVSPAVWTIPFKGGWNAITLAAASQSISTVDEVLSRAEMNSADVLALVETTKGKTALHIAAELGDLRMIHHLLDKGASPWALTKSGTTPLYRVAASSSLNGLKVLYESVESDRRLDYVNMKSWDNWTALTNAVVQGRPLAAEFLLEKGADWSVSTLQGHTALSLSERMGQIKIRSLLVSKMNMVSETTIGLPNELGNASSAHTTSPKALPFVSKGTCHRDLPNDGSLSLKEQLFNATSFKSRSEVLQDAFCEKLAHMLQQDAKYFDRSNPLPSYGIDSLMAMEARAWFANEVQADFPYIMFIATGTIESICNQAVAELYGNTVTMPKDA